MAFTYETMAKSTVNCVILMQFTEQVRTTMIHGMKRMGERVQLGLIIIEPKMPSSIFV